MKKVFSLVLITVLILALTSAAFASTGTNLLEQGAHIISNTIEKTSGMVVQFTDIVSNWAKEYIQKLTELGAIFGKGDGLFHPTDPLLRSEFTAILLRALGNDVGQPPAGSEEKWYKYYIEEAERKGYIKGGEFTDSNVNQNITKIEIARMLTRAMGKESIAIALKGVSTQFKDDSQIASSDKGYVWVCVKYGIINGTPDGYFQPTKSADRAEATKMLTTFLDNKDKAINIDVEEIKRSTELYMNDGKTGEEIKVETSHPELIPLIKNGINILSSEGGYLEAEYFTASNKVQLIVFKSKEEAEKPVWERHPYFAYYIFTETDPRMDFDKGFDIHLYDTKNIDGQEKFKDIIKDCFPEAYNIAVKELNNKVADTNYKNQVWKKVNGRELRIFTFEGHNQIDVYIQR